MSKKKESDFGAGFIYNLVLFAEHRFMDFDLSKDTASLVRATWFNGSSDHLYELEVPESLPADLKKKISAFRDKMLDLGHGKGFLARINPDVAVDVEKDIGEALSELHDICVGIDRHLGVETKLAEWN